ncbi:DUF3592 domain-containing protein [Deinococcus psychrotolerans]|uniref:DUF3592 domain-containing protein n=1 Tax=Deinococcus psychrotolerans TaxID=2489213 RepID=A0A3G8YE45_9DEIO|nr:DUF3592 domain-containing protein [Deinococcus psychrotolerans]AZI43120.1 DUF3592 domain-containing protein [Deinococcus psychrotolerans]
MPRESQALYDLKIVSCTVGKGLARIVGSLAIATSIGGLFLVPGLFFWFFAVPGGLSTLNWEPHPGQLIYYTIPYCARVPNPSIKAFVEYSYVVGTQKYIGRDIAGTTFYLTWTGDNCGTSLLSQYVAEARLNKGGIQVFVDPKNPQKAVLFRGVKIPTSLENYLPFLLSGVIAYWPTLLIAGWMENMRAANAKRKERFLRRSDRN